MPSLSPVLRVETGPGHAGIDGHAALHLNPLPDSYCVNKHGRHNLCLSFRPLAGKELNRPMSGPVVSENLHLSIYLWANDKPARGLIAKFQLCQVPANQPVLPGLLKPGSLLTRLKEGNLPLHPPLHRRG